MRWPDAGTSVAAQLSPDVVDPEGAVGYTAPVPGVSQPPLPQTAPKKAEPRLKMIVKNVIALAHPYPKTLAERVARLTIRRNFSGVAVLNWLKNMVLRVERKSFLHILFIS
jgi:hypothetical protein